MISRGISPSPLPWNDTLGGRRSRLFTGPYSTSSNTRVKKATARKALHIQEILGPDYAVLEFETSTRSAAEAAAAVGCEVAQIAKTLVFRTEDGTPLLVIASGAHRVDEAAVGAALGRTIERADADFVRDATGYAIGGVPPVGHRRRLPVLLDETLLAHDEIWAAAGTPSAVFRLSPAALAELTGGTFVSVLKGSAESR